VIVLDANGNPLSSSPGVVLLSSSLGWLDPVTDHGNGRYTARLTAGLVPGVAMVTGTLNGQMIGDTAFVTLRPRKADPGRTTITADSTAMNADGVSGTRVIVTVMDAAGIPVGVGGAVIALTTTLGSLSAVITDHQDGTYSAVLTAGTIAGTAVVAGTVNGQAIADNALVVLRPLAVGDPKESTIRADSTAINADGVATTRILVTVFDASGRPVAASAGIVALATTRGTLSGVVDHGDGTYTATLTAGFNPGSAVISGTLNGSAIGGKATVVFR
jgi:adhesin/invasin